MAVKKSKRRGGKIGNKNAQKHGFYSMAYSMDAKGVDTAEEQQLLRSYIHDLAMWVKMKKASNEKPSEDSRLAYFHAILLAVAAVDSIERTILLKRGKGGDIGNTILEALTALENEPL